MAVAHDAVSESHTGTAGVASVASFNWNHVPTGTPRSALVCTVALGANPVTGVTYGGTAMTAVPYTAYDSDTEPFFLQCWFLDNVPSGTQNIVVSRTNNAVVTYAVAVTQTAAGATEVYNAGVQTRAASGAQQSGASASGTGVASAWQTLTGVTDGSPGTNSQRYMFVGSGASSVPTAGTNASSTSAGGYIDFGNYVFQSFYETTPSQGAKDLSVGVAISDDLAVIGLAVREAPASGNQLSGGATFGWSPAATLSENFIVSSSAPAFGWAPGGELSWPLPITIDSGGGAFGFSPGGTLAETFATSGGATFGWTPGGTLAETFATSGGATFGWSPSGTLAETFSTSGGATFGWSPAGTASEEFQTSGGAAFGFAPGGSASEDFIIQMGWDFV